jgi:hypothetical protein
MWIQNKNISTNTGRDSIFGKVTSEDEDQELEEWN